MELGFSNIIGQGQAVANAAKQQAFQNLGAGIGDGITAVKQHKFNNEFQKLLDQGIIGNISPEQKAEIEAQKRNMAMIGDMRGLRTPLQTLQHEDNLAAQKAREEYQARQEEKNRAHQVYNNAMSQYRMILNQATMAEATGPATPEFRKSIDAQKAEANRFLAQAESAKKLGLNLGLPSEYFADTGIEQNTGTETSNFSNVQGKEADFAEAFMKNNRGYPNTANLSKFLSGQGLNLRDGDFNKILAHAKSIYDSQGINSETDFETKKREYELAKQQYELADAKRKGITGDQEAVKATAWNTAQAEFLKNPASASYTTENAIALGRLFPDFKSNEAMGGRTIADVIASWANKKLNENQRRLEYETFFKAMKGMLPADTPPVVTPPSQATEKPAKRRVGQ